jgi:hypothetical protein
VPAVIRVEAGNSAKQCSLYTKAYCHCWICLNLERFVIYNPKYQADIRYISWKTNGKINIIWVCLLIRHGVARFADYTGKEGDYSPHTSSWVVSVAAWVNSYSPAVTNADSKHKCVFISEPMWDTWGNSVTWDRSQICTMYTNVKLHKGNDNGTSWKMLID